ncbi:hypothetical protein COCON_G00220920 [Conger conger]|uniref:Uncharacterized protein n=1 Tax=Conger conger TaxID=82655 RepID=A0A9Q1HKH8_CONCO|nr:hypothetical protein COCON_G00220920 [Conger conger]
MDGQNYVPRLNELVQKSRFILKFEDVCVDGPDHCRTFTMKAVINDKDYPVGVGRNKKEAKQNAAKNAFHAILGESVQQNDSADMTRPAQCPSPQSTIGLIAQPNYVCWLNEYSHKTRVAFKAIESLQMGQSYSSQYCKYVADGKEFPGASASSRKEAKELAAKKVYEELMRESNKQAVDESRTGNATGQDEALSQSVSASLGRLNGSPTLEDNNFIGTLNHYCQKTKRVCDYKYVENKGPSHDPIFVYRVVIDKNEYPACEGKTAKEAKQRAAAKAWEILKEQPDWDSQVSCWSPVTEKSTLSPPSVRESEDEAGTHNQAESSSGGIVFKSSSNAVTPKMAGDVKPRRIMAPRFSNALIKENVVKNNNLGKSPEKNTQSTDSVFLKDYDQIEAIGKGGFGRVFKARKIIEDKNVAVKIVKSTKKALREVAALSDLQHLHIVRYYHAWIESTRYQGEPSESSSSTSDSGAPDNFMYIQMELCEGGTLRAWIDNRNRSYQEWKTRDKEALVILQQMVDGVKYIHSKKLIHRDLKPLNIMFASDKTLKIGDFGLVTSAESDSDGAMLERTKKTGTRWYMSPEQMNQSKYDKEVDIFALGLIFFEVLWKMTTVCEKSDFCVPHYSVDYKLIEQMLSENPADRPDAPAIAAELEKYQTCIKKDQQALQDMKTI